MAIDASIVAREFRSFQLPAFFERVVEHFNSLDEGRNSRDCGRVTYRQKTRDSQLAYISLVATFGFQYTKRLKIDDAVSMADFITQRIPDLATAL